MKKVLSFILLGAMLLTLIPMAVFADTASSVENTFDPDKGEYGISTAADLLAFSQALVTKNDAFSGKTVYLNADIDMAGRLLGQTVDSAAVHLTVEDIRFQIWISAI